MNLHIRTCPRLLRHAIACLLFVCTANFGGCSKETPTSEQTSGPQLESSDTNARENMVNPSDPQGIVSNSPQTESVGAPIPAPAIVGSEPAEPASPSEASFGEGLPKTNDPSSPAVLEPRPLRSDLSPQELVDFLAGADHDMQQIYSGAAGIRDNNVALARMREIGKLKLEAAKRLRDHTGASEQQRVDASRGVLQSLSHLAALGDLGSANELEDLATENLSAEDPRIASDSRLVLIGFAIESLEHGKADALEKIVELAEGLRQSPAKPDVPAMMVLGQARQMLAQYGHDEQAATIREVIVDLFADSDDPQIASMAAQLAGNAQNDAIDRLLESAISGGDVSVAAWKEAAEKLAGESADLMSVQYLAGAALEFEASSRDDLANTTYDLLLDRFGERNDKLGDEARIALDAREARREVIGLVFDPALSQIDGTPLSMSQFSGKVELMPNWASGFPQSLQILPLLEKIRDAHPDKVAIVGMNLDPEDAPTQQFVKQNQLDFPSYQSASSPTAKVVNAVATRFGMVSMPFVAVLDQQGRVVALDFKGQKIQQIVDDLLSQ